ncbi:adenylate cyclase [Roseiarcus fermentans]|uniref:Adenylate cyclase n=1 Tax=Roseiarcus fermentans TaxID=1473586 RepID=A0A366FQP3_9HYPH|nr:adenylate/guanylate cyclase domain-containing protein [Roseiarcus fermentans]RBP16360.1 adenylate cyclase [Roseiarcus fermentans]
MSDEDARRRIPPPPGPRPRPLARRAVRRAGLLVWASLAGFAIGVGYRFLFDQSAEATLGNFLRSGLHGVGLGFTVWSVQIGFASAERSRFGARLRRLPLAVEALVKALTLTVALIAVGLALQALLYAEPYRLDWLTRRWLTTNLPRIVAIGFGLSLVFGALAETLRLIGRPMLTSVLLGTYLRPSREQRIVMFLDLAHSTRLAEAMGELRVHDLITRFFFDIDEAISDSGGEVHAYVGDEVVILWPVTGNRALDSRCVASFFAIDDAIVRLAPAYRAEFGLVPEFRAGAHVGPVIVSECGGEKRQLALFGDTMNVGSRLCDHCKSVNARFVASGDLVGRITIPDGVRVAEAVEVAIRGRQSPVVAHVVERAAPRDDRRCG